MADTRVNKTIPSKVKVKGQAKTQPSAKAPSESQKKTNAKSQPHSKRGFHLTPKLEKNIALTVFYIAWVPLVFLLVQYLIFFLMYFLLGNRLQETGWNVTYRILVYILATTTIIFAPPYLIKIIKKLFTSNKNAQKALPAIEKLAQDVSPNPTELGVQRPPSFIDIGLAPIAYITYAVLANLLVTLMQVFPWFNANQAQDVGFSYFITDLDRILAMITLVFVAPITEELMMRGWLYGKLRSKWGILISMILTSIIFAVLHGQWNVGVTVFVLSIILCSMREITGTIWSGMLLHILSNAIAFYFLYVAI